MTIDTRTVLFKITGKVQGVWFRAYSRDSALSLNIDGWVKNDPDGSVFGKAVGSEKNMEKFIVHQNLLIINMGYQSVFQT